MGKAVPVAGLKTREQASYLVVVVVVWWSVCGCVGWNDLFLLLFSSHFFLSVFSLLFVVVVVVVIVLSFSSLWVSVASTVVRCCYTCTV